MIVIALQIAADNWNKGCVALYRHACLMYKERQFSTRHRSDDTADLSQPTPCLVYCHLWLVTLADTCVTVAAARMPQNRIDNNPSWHNTADWENRNDVGKDSRKAKKILAVQYKIYENFPLSRTAWMRLANLGIWNDTWSEIIMKQHVWCCAIDQEYKEMASLLDLRMLCFRISPSEVQCSVHEQQTQTNLSYSKFLWMAYTSPSMWCWQHSFTSHQAE